MADGFPPFPIDCAPGSKWVLIGTCQEEGGLLLSWVLSTEIGGMSSIVAPSAGGCGGAVKMAIEKGWDPEKVIELAKALAKG